MKIRSSENSHEFQERLFNRLKAYSLQGLLMNSNHEFTAAVEAVQYDDCDDENVPAFSDDQLHARCVLAENIGIPFYLLCYVRGIYRVNRVETKDNGIKTVLENELNEDGFADWWAELKQTTQTKQLNNGGETRLRETVFDTTLRKHGLEWGGNIDGFMLSDDGKKVKCIIDNISVSRSDLNDEPSHYFNSTNPKHGPRYEGWYGAVKLAKTLNVPHILFTIDKKSPTCEHIGFTVFDKLTPDGIYYVENVKPNNNILNGLENIVRVVNDKVRTSSAPKLVEKEDA